MALFSRFGIFLLFRNPENFTNRFLLIWTYILLAARDVWLIFKQIIPSFLVVNVLRLSDSSRRASFFLNGITLNFIVFNYLTNLVVWRSHIGNSFAIDFIIFVIDIDWVFVFKVNLFGADLQPIFRPKLRPFLWPNLRVLMLASFLSFRPLLRVGLATTSA